jgi:hypothetical protein
MKTLTLLIAFTIAAFCAAFAEEVKPAANGTPQHENGIYVKGEGLTVGISVPAFFVFHTDKGDIKLNCRTGAVELSKEFWKAVARAFPEAKRQIIEGERKP